MCMLCVFPPGKTPDKNKLINSALNNPHGFGFAIAIPSENRILVHKTMDADESVNEFLRLREQYPDGYGMWHARFATHGTTDIDNCHPFAVDGQGLTWLGHNGILDTLEDKSGRSDTRIFAEDILPNMGGIHALDNEQIYNVIEGFSRGSKLCILTVDPAAEFACYIINEKDGWKGEDGIWWSNNTCYLTASTYAWGNKYYEDEDLYNRTWPTVGKEYKNDDEDMYTCGICDTPYDLDVIDDLHNGNCPVCGCCVECEEYNEVCICYKPPRRSNNWQANEEKEREYATLFAPEPKELVTSQHAVGDWIGHGIY